MPRTTSRSALGSVPNENVPGVAISNTNDLRKDCASAINRALKIRHLRFTNLKRVPGDCCISELTGQGATIAEAKYRCQVIPILVPIRRDILWLAVTLEMWSGTRGCYLMSAGLQVFEGQAQDDIKKPLIRGEWRCTPDDRTAEHAQPHWHIYPATITEVSEDSRAEFRLETEIQQFNAESRDLATIGVRFRDWYRGEHFHFAMASRWDTEGVESHKRDLDAANLPDWLQGCVTYTLQQLQYVDRKTADSIG